MLDHFLVMKLNDMKNLMKKFDKVFAGEETITLKMKDLSGNSAIISDKAQVKKIKA